MLFQADVFADEEFEHESFEVIENSLESLEVSDKDLVSFEEYSDIEESYEDDVSIHISNAELQKVLESSYANNKN